MNWYTRLALHQVKTKIQALLNIFSIQVFSSNQGSSHAAFDTEVAVPGQKTGWTKGIKREKSLIRYILRIESSLKAQRASQHCQHHSAKCRIAIYDHPKMPVPKQNKGWGAQAALNSSWRTAEHFSFLAKHLSSEQQWNWGEETMPGWTGLG